MPVRSRHGLTVCPRCRAHVEAGERPSTTVCPFCEKGTSISQVGRSGVLAGALLAFACGGAEASPPDRVEPQRDPQVRVCPNVIGHHTGGALRCQDEVNAEAATPLGNPDQGGKEIREFFGQRSKLIDHYDQPWHHLRIAVGPIVRQVGRPNHPQQFLATMQFRLQADECPFGQPGIQIGDDSNGVRQPGARIECGTALVVDQNKREMVRAEL